MGGGGGGGAFVNRSPDDLRHLVRKAEDKTAAAAFQAELANTLGGLLGDYNARDVETARERLDAVKAALQGSIEGSFDQLFGGSVAKHTYVDGLSDIDSPRADQRQRASRQQSAAGASADGAYP